MSVNVQNDQHHRSQYSRNVPDNPSEDLAALV